MLYKKRIVKFVARVMLLTLGAELVCPGVSFALTSGPSQPEVQSFEPVGTTDMVDMFTGDFVYNIPLLDVEGYPVNISYHSGGDMEQEASWVGLGWNINPGVVNRSVRGLPDDFNGEVIGKELNMKEERNVRVGLNGGIELAGAGSPLISIYASLGASVNSSNYRGVSVDFNLGLNAGVNVVASASAGVNLGVGSQSGADVDYNLGLGMRSSQILGSDVAAGVGFNYSHGYNTRAGLKDKAFSLSANVSLGGKNIALPTYTKTVPIGIKNIVPVITNSTVMRVYRGQIKLGGELLWTYEHAAVFGMVSSLKYQQNGSMKSYGYLYAENADDASILDFTRDRDGMFNETMPYLPAGNMTYDVYSVSGQGTGGSFRPYRNDYGSVYDPAVSSEGSEFGINLEAGIGNLFEIGTDITMSNTDITSGPWQEYKRPFTSREAGSIYENTYFKQAGEVTEVNEGLWSALSGTEPMSGTATPAIPIRKPGSDMKRDARGNLISYFTGNEARIYGVASDTALYSYTSTNGFAGGANTSRTAISRVGGARKGHHISEVAQTQTDGRRYVYGIAALNTRQDELTFAVGSGNETNGLATYSDQDASAGNQQGIDHFFSKTSTPSFAHSYLLTSVLSADYVDVTGNGATDDDFGSFTKFNYTRKNAAYGWKAPYGDHVAQYNPGFRSDTRDNKASVVQGEREQWMLHNMETKNFVAEFYTSVRNDGRGVDTATDLSYKLDSIKLYNKHDRFINTTAAVPIKTVIFQYDYSLCKGVANNAHYIRTHAKDDQSGKLTLKKIFIRYGNSDRSMISPYQFSYGHNRDYNFANKDRWGMFKENGTPANPDFPFVNQDDPNLDSYASSWSLETITLPSGGNIHITYEADDYAYVQDRRAMEMFMLKGMGSSDLFQPGNQLYVNKDNPNLYFYFKRRQNAETPGMSLRDVYLGGHDLLYYNCDVRLTENKYEAIKGYAEVESVGVCANNTNYGYVKTKPVVITGGGALLNHTTYTAINFGRYYLPHVIFPGANPDDSDLSNVLAGLQYAFSELMSVAQNPVKRMVQESKAKEIRLEKSFIRLNSPGLRKKGGGQRVKELSFSDNWSGLAGGNTQTATYGKRYEYTTVDQGSYGTISSGVASYEPQIGGDENPYRLPADYSVQSGSKFPPNDPVGVYQELPIGESLYPAPVVGYSRVTVKSIHQEEGRSSQGEDIYDFYTAKDFPIQAKATKLDVLAKMDQYDFQEQYRRFDGAQGFSLVMNDMHGKPKRTEHRIIKPSTGVSELVSYQQYTYFSSGNQLSNMIPVVAYDPQTHAMHRSDKQVGVEADITIDTREKKEHTSSTTTYLNLNVVMIGPVPVPLAIPPYYDADFNFRNEFHSVVSTKVIQQYGILKEVQSYQQGAVTTVRNEAFDPITGQAIITSVNNEFNDKEYTVTYPAYWGYKSMGPSYVNTGYEQKFPEVSVLNYAARLPAVSAAHFKVGDELLFTYKESGVIKQSNAWVMSMFISDTMPRTLIKCGYPWCNGINVPGPNIIDTVEINASQFEFMNSEVGCSPSLTRDRGSCGNLTLIVKPRYKYSWPQNGHFTDVSVKVIRSGAKNQLNEVIQNYTAMEPPFDDNNNLKYNLSGLIDLSAKEFSDTLTAVLPRFDSTLGATGWDSLNVYVNGIRQIKRLSKEYAYQKKRDYAGSNRRAGLFSALSLWRPGSVSDYCTILDKYCYVNYGGGPYDWNGSYSSPLRVLHYLAYQPPSYITDYNTMTPHPGDDANWVVARTVTKWSPWGFELENKDAIGNYTAAMYGYNQQLPTALGQNARQHEMFSDGFEDYQLLQLTAGVTRFAPSPFAGFFSLAGIGGTLYGRYNLSGSSGLSVTNTAAHTGLYTLSTGASPSLLIKAGANPEPVGQPRYIPLTLQSGKKYYISYWFRPKVISGVPNAYSAVSGMQLKSNIIEGWQQAEGMISVSPSASFYTLTLPANAYVDDIRILPMDANMKSFVYHPVNQRLIATLDENNFASMYEYDQEGNLVRTKKETEKGIITVMESRSANQKSN